MARQSQAAWRDTPRLEVAKLQLELSSRRANEMRTKDFEGSSSEPDWLRVIRRLFAVRKTVSEGDESDDSD